MKTLDYTQYPLNVLNQATALIALFERNVFGPKRVTARAFELAEKLDPNCTPERCRAVAFTQGLDLTEQKVYSRWVNATWTNSGRKEPEWKTRLTQEIIRAYAQMILKEKGAQNFPMALRAQILLNTTQPSQPVAPQNGGVTCDVQNGPCACGAWHKDEPTEPKPKSRFVSDGLGRVRQQFKASVIVHDEGEEPKPLRKPQTHIMRLREMGVLLTAQEFAPLVGKSPAYVYAHKDEYETARKGSRVFFFTKQIAKY